MNSIIHYISHTIHQNIQSFQDFLQEKNKKQKIRAYIHQYKSVLITLTGLAFLLAIVDLTLNYKHLYFGGYHTKRGGMIHQKGGNPVVNTGKFLFWDRLMFVFKLCLSIIAIGLFLMAPIVLYLFIIYKIFKLILFKFKTY